MCRGPMFAESLFEPIYDWFISSSPGPLLEETQRCRRCGWIRLMETQMVWRRTPTMLRDLKVARIRGWGNW